jgi:hypothetical protein
MAALACAQTNQAANPQSTGTQPTNSQPAKAVPATEPASPSPIKPSAVSAAASASRLARQSASATKVIRNHDLSDGSNSPDDAKSQSKESDVAAMRAAQDKEAQEEERKEQRFEAQGKTFQNQIKVQKGKIIDIQNRITSLKNQFAAWSAGYSQDADTPACWTSAYYSPYYKDWCDTGRNLKTQYEASQRQLAQEKARLEQMQENIRRAGYGNAVYDPD